MYCTLFFWIIDSGCLVWLTAETEETKKQILVENLQETSLISQRIVYDYMNSGCTSTVPLANPVKKNENTPWNPLNLPLKIVATLLGDYSVPPDPSCFSKPLRAFDCPFAAKINFCRKISLSGTPPNKLLGTRLNGVCRNFMIINATV